MQPEVLPILGAGALAGTIAMAAAIVDRFSKPLATTCVLIGGLAPWIYMLGWFTSIPGWAAGFGLFGGAPLFLIAAWLFKSDWRGEPSKAAFTLSSIGLLAGGACTLLILRQLARIP